MSKLGGIRKNWKKRWFVAYKNALVCSRTTLFFFLRHPVFLSFPSSCMHQRACAKSAAMMSLMHAGWVSVSDSYSETLV